MVEIMINENLHEKFNTLIQETVIEKKKTKNKKQKRKKTQISFLIITLIIKVFQ